MSTKKTNFRLVIVLVTALLFLIAAVVWWFWAVGPADKQNTASQIFIIEKGEGLSSVALKLDQEGLIKSALAFKILVLKENLAGQIQAGDFYLKPSLNAEETAYILTHGVVDIWLTFPEGWRREEFSRRLGVNLTEFDQAEFLELTRDLEGYLFPDTYLIPQEAGAAAALKIISQNFEKRLSSDLIKAAQAENLTLKQVLILASMVEREAGQDKDRPLIAGILLKRWRENWPLQVDATIQYAVDSLRCRSSLECDYWTPLKNSDLKYDSPYNTYLYKGLPPAPICNPGLASIKAVIEPQFSDYWFYLSDSQGRVHYSATNEEHNQKKKQYLP